MKRNLQGETGIYRESGLQEVIVATGNFTELGGSLMPEEVLEAMLDAARSFVDIRALHEWAGQVIVNVTGAEAGYVTSGAAAGLVLATAACMTGSDPAAVQQLPDCESLKNEVVIHKAHSSHYNRMFRLAGAKVKEVGYGTHRTLPWQLESALDESTAAIVYLVSQILVSQTALPLSEVLRIARAQGVPVIVDAANELPPVENLRKFIEMGADLVIFSGGKDLQGPQPSGFICGRRDLIEACALNGAPNHGIGRPMKVGKEEIVGLVAALKRYVRLDHQARLARWEQRVSLIVDGLADVGQLRVSRVFPDYTGRPVPRAWLTWDEEAAGLSRQEVLDALAKGSPVIRVMEEYAGKGLLIDPTTLLDGQEAIIAEVLRRIFAGRGSARPRRSVAPGVQEGKS
ncbi:MAG: aminotransferase class V-fold PLP-dependent enzyme [Anaerolineaceae bacterium]|nr:aminotransferase class V-fold PLP-dependent enzyme [Anaerolineaceae bacterium]MDE0328469.1 aminotransferase class V-fold PLP-dependent enzyme [Anaerolineaceae bacterium]